MAIYFQPSAMRKVKNGVTYLYLDKDQIKSNDRLDDIYQTTSSGWIDGFISTGLDHWHYLHNEDDSPVFIIDMPEWLDRDDFFITQEQGDYVNAGAGHDIISTERGDDFVKGGEGNDRIFAGGDNDLVMGGEGDDTIYGDGTYMVHRSHRDWLDEVPLSHFGGFDWSLLSNAVWHGVADHVNYAGNDKIFGGDGNDTIYGGAGDDTLKGENGNDTIHAGEGADKVWGNEGNDRVFGNEGNDRLGGENGNDFIDGGAGSDLIWGGDGNDILVAGVREGDDNTDFMTGGRGRDLFFLNSAKTETETVEAANGLYGFLGDTADSVGTATAKELAGMAGTALGGKLGGFIAKQVAGSAIDLVGLAIDGLNQIEEEIEDTSAGRADTTTITDFNPLEDVVVLPKGSITREDGSVDSFALTFAIVSADVNRGANLTRESALQVKYSLNGGTEVEFAKIFLDPNFVAEMNIGAQSVSAEQILDQISKRALEIDASGVGGAIDGANGVSDQNEAAEGVEILGAVGGLVVIDPDVPDGAPVIGTNFGDLLSANEAWIQPGEEGSLNGDVNAEEGFELHGFGGDDVLQGSANADELFGGSGNDAIYTMGAGGKLDKVDAGAGNDEVFVGADYSGEQHRDKLIADGGEGRDTISFEYASDGVNLEYVGNKVVGHDANESGEQYQLAGFETFVGSAHADTFDFSGQYSSNHPVTIKAGAGDDIIIGTRLHDTFYGQAGADTFVFGEHHGSDMILDFSSAEGDKIDLSALTEISDFDDLIDNHLTIYEGFCEIDTGEGYIAIQGVHLTNNDAGMFTF